MAIKGILFDKDGTLVDFEKTWSVIADAMALRAADGDRARADELLRLAGYDLVRKCFRADSVFAAGTNADIVALWYPHLPPEEQGEMVAVFDRFTAVEGAAMAVALPGALNALRVLHGAGLKLGVATNDSTAGAEQTVLALGVAQLFDAAYGYDAVANPKPAPDVLLAFADLTGLEPSEIALVGDNRHDLDTARAAAAGLAVGVLSGTGTRETLTPLADVILDSIADLPDLLLTKVTLPLVGRVGP
jgi:phosphoglycolate phosphatase